MVPAEERREENKSSRVRGEKAICIRFIHIRDDMYTFSQKVYISHLKTVENDHGTIRSKHRME